MVDAALTKARVWATAAFALQGFMQALVLTNLPGLEDRTNIGDSEVSLVVLSVLVLAAVGSLVGGAVAVRRGSAFLLVPAFAIQAAAVSGSVSCTIIRHPNLCTSRDASGVPAGMGRGG